ncbi:MAG: endo-1,4-beta-xylanase [Treponema sp.]|jgi:endo-1,4-beta-xylanase|nr:endo-1,4-beta-xylanase [Treponema sp.]
MNNGLKDAWGKLFKIGAAVNRRALEQKENVDIIRKHFSSLTSGNAMKMGCIHPREDSYYWDEADFITGFAQREGLAMRGHTIMWHNQTSDWVFLDGNEDVSKNKLFKRLEDHIFSVTQRYNDYIYAWDVINELIDAENGDENIYRKSKWYQIGGKEIYDFAFKKMREASPKAKLFYNDYNNESGVKLETTLRYLSSMLDRGIPVDGVGIQGHWYFNFPDENILRNALERYSALGLDIELTEIDVSVYEWTEAREKRDFFTSRPEDRILKQADIYMNVFKAASDYPAVKNITTWGISDKHTWLDNFPVKERKNWPLLFDEQNREKPVVAQLIEAGMKKNL